ncbi:MAG: metal ABC transporter permease [Candidatus Saliniplasma sp.]
MFDILQYTFMRNAIYAGILASLIFGIIGTLVVVKRIVFISGGIAHASFGGVGMAFYLGIDPLIGASLFTVVSALGVGILGERKIEREDTTIGVIWAVGMALGAFFYSITPGYLPSPASFLFGNIVMIRRLDILLLMTLTVVILLSVTFFYHKLHAISFDEEFSKVVGVNTFYLNILLLLLVAFSIVFLIKFVGIILVIALLTIPASISNHFTHDMKRIMVYSSILSLTFIMSGLWISHTVDTAAGPTIVLLAGGVFVLITVLSKFLKH